MRLFAAFTICLLLAGVVVTLSLQGAKADINDEDEKGKKAHLGLLAAEDFNNDNRGSRWITRNLIDARPIPVCSTDFPNATQEAIKRWNAALKIPAFGWRQNVDDCIVDRPEGGWKPQEGVVSVIVSFGHVDDSDKTRFRPHYIGGRGCPIGIGPQLLNGTRACAGFEAIKYRDPDVQAMDKWRSYHGRAEVILNRKIQAYQSDIDPANYVEASRDVVHDIAHELGHILALADYYCGRTGHPDYLAPGIRALMNSFNLVPACDPPDRDGERGRPTELDLKDYRAAYTPAIVAVNGSDIDGQTVTLHWNQSNVFVESDFEIQRKNGEIWEMEEIADANAESITLTNQPGGEQLYRIRARTLALCPAEEDCRQVRKHFYGDPSAEITVSVPLPAPSVSAIGSSDITTNSVMLRWSEVPGAGGYEVKRTEGSGETDIESLAAAARSHPFSGLTPSTPYTFYVRATHGSNSALTSAWADAGATTKPPLLQIEVSGEPKECDRGESVGLNWEVKGGQSPYSVLFGGTRITYLSTVTSGSRSVNCQLGSVTVKVTDADGGSASKSVSWTVNEPYIPPTQTFTLIAKVSSTSCLVGASVSVTWSTRNGSGDVFVTINNNSPVTTSPIYVRCQSAGSQEIVVRARDGANSLASHTFHVRVKEATNLVECLLHTGYGGNALLYRGSVCLGATASALWSGLASANIAVGCISKWDVQRQEWLAYQSGRTDFNVVIRDTLWLSSSACASTGDASGAAGASASPCADTVKPTQGPTAVSVGSATCLIVRGGGAAQITDGTHTLNLTLPTGRNWALFAAADFTGSTADAFWFLDLTTGGWLALNPATAAELARHAPADAEGLPALLDAIAASASVPATE